MITYPFNMCSTWADATPLIPDTGKFADSLPPLLGLAKGLLIVLIFSNNLLLVSLIFFFIDFLISIWLISKSDLYFYFHQFSFGFYLLFFFHRKLRWLIWDLPSFLIRADVQRYTFILFIAFVALHTFWYVVFSFSLSLKYFVCILISLWPQVI